eukprot:PhM_4_TR17083/c0_g1_i1/m.58514
MAHTSSSSSTNFMNVLTTSSNSNDNYNNNTNGGIREQRRGGSNNNNNHINGNSRLNPNNNDRMIDMQQRYSAYEQFQQEQPQHGRAPHLLFLQHSDDDDADREARNVMMRRARREQQQQQQRRAVSIDTGNTELVQQQQRRRTSLVMANSAVLVQGSAHRIKRAQAAVSVVHGSLEEGHLTPQRQPRHTVPTPPSRPGAPSPRWDGYDPFGDDDASVNTDDTPPPPPPPTTNTAAAAFRRTSRSRSQCSTDDDEFGVPPPPPPPMPPTLFQQQPGYLRPTPTPSSQTDDDASSHGDVFRESAVLSLLDHRTPTPPETPGLRPSNIALLRNSNHNPKYTPLYQPILAQTTTASSSTAGDDDLLAHITTKHLISRRREVYLEGFARMCMEQSFRRHRLMTAFVCSVRFDLLVPFATEVRTMLRHEEKTERALLLLPMKEAIKRSRVLSSAYEFLYMTFPPRFVRHDEVAHRRWITGEESRERFLTCFLCVSVPWRVQTFIKAQHSLLVEWESCTRFDLIEDQLEAPCRYVLECAFRTIVSGSRLAALYTDLVKPALALTYFETAARDRILRDEAEAVSCGFDVPAAEAVAREHNVQREEAMCRARLSVQLLCDEEVCHRGVLAREELLASAVTGRAAVHTAWLHQTTDYIRQFVEIEEFTNRWWLRAVFDLEREHLVTRSRNVVLSEQCTRLDAVTETHARVVLMETECVLRNEMHERWVLLASQHRCFVEGIVFPALLSEHQMLLHLPNGVEAMRVLEFEEIVAREGVERASTLDRHAHAVDAWAALCVDETSPALVDDLWLHEYLAGAALPLVHEHIVGGWLLEMHGKVVLPAYAGCARILTEETAARSLHIYLEHHEEPTARHQILQQQFDALAGGAVMQLEHALRGCLEREEVEHLCNDIVIRERVVRAESVARCVYVREMELAQRLIFVLAPEKFEWCCRISEPCDRESIAIIEAQLRRELCFRILSGEHEAFVRQHTIVDDESKAWLEHVLFPFDRGVVAAQEYAERDFLVKCIALYSEAVSSASRMSVALDEVHSREGIHRACTATIMALAGTAASAAQLQCLVDISAVHIIATEVTTRLVNVDEAAARECITLYEAAMVRDVLATRCTSQFTLFGAFTMRSALAQMCLSPQCPFRSLICQYQEPMERRRIAHRLAASTIAVEVHWDYFSNLAIPEVVALEALVRSVHHEDLCRRQLSRMCCAALEERESIDRRLCTVCPAETEHLLTLHEPFKRLMHIEAIETRERRRTLDVQPQRLRLLAKEELARGFGWARLEVCEREALQRAILDSLARLELTDVFVWPLQETLRCGIAFDERVHRLHDLDEWKGRDHLCCDERRTRQEVLTTVIGVDETYHRENVIERTKDVVFMWNIHEPFERLMHIEVTETRERRRTLDVQPQRLRLLAKEELARDFGWARLEVCERETLQRAILDSLARLDFTTVVLLPLYVCTYLEEIEIPEARARVVDLEEPLLRGALVLEAVILSRALSVTTQLGIDESVARDGVQVDALVLGWEKIAREAIRGLEAIVWAQHVVTPILRSLSRRQYVEHIEHPQERQWLVEIVWPFQRAVHETQLQMDHSVVLNNLLFVLEGVSRVCCIAHVEGTVFLELIEWFNRTNAKLSESAARGSLFSEMVVARSSIYLQCGHRRLAFDTVVCAELVEREFLYRASTQHAFFAVSGARFQMISDHLEKCFSRIALHSLGAEEARRRLVLVDEASVRDRIEIGYAVRRRSLVNDFFPLVLRMIESEEVQRRAFGLYLGEKMAFLQIYEAKRRLRRSWDSIHLLSAICRTQRPRSRFLHIHEHARTTDVLLKECSGRESLQRALVGALEASAFCLEVISPALMAEFVLCCYTPLSREMQIDLSVAIPEAFGRSLVAASEHSTFARVTGDEMARQRLWHFSFVGLHMAVDTVEVSQREALQRAAIEGEGALVLCSEFRTRVLVPTEEYQRDRLDAARARELVEIEEQMVRLLHTRQVHVFSQRVIVLQFGEGMRRILDVVLAHDVQSLELSRRASIEHTALSTVLSVRHLAAMATKVVALERDEAQARWAQVLRKELVERALGIEASAIFAEEQSQWGQHVVCAAHRSALACDEAAARRRVYIEELVECGLVLFSRHLRLQVDSTLFCAFMSLEAVAREHIAHCYEATMDRFLYVRCLMDNEWRARSEVNLIESRTRELLVARFLKLKQKAVAGDGPNAVISPISSPLL